LVRRDEVARRLLPVGVHQQLLPHPRALVLPVVVVKANAAAAADRAAADRAAAQRRDARVRQDRAAAAARGRGAVGRAPLVAQLEHQLPLGARVRHHERGGVRRCPARAAAAAAAAAAGLAAAVVVRRAAGGSKRAEHLGQLREGQAEANVAVALGALVLGK